MTLNEQYQWLSSISTQADTLFAEPEDMLMVAGCLLSAALSKVPKADRKRVLNEWIDHTVRCNRLLEVFSDNVSRH